MTSQTPIQTNTQIQSPAPETSGIDTPLTNDSLNDKTLNSLNHQTIVNKLKQKAMRMTGGKQENQDVAATSFEQPKNNNANSDSLGATLRSSKMFKMQRRSDKE